MFDRAHGSWRNIPNDTPEFLPVILRDRPGYCRLTYLLSILALKPLTWDDDDESARKPPPLIPYTEDEINKFCVEIISAIGKEKMSWLREEKDGNDIAISVSEQKDKLMDLASLRISERCGYAGMYILPCLYRNLSYLLLCVKCTLVFYSGPLLPCTLIFRVIRRRLIKNV